MKNYYEFNSKLIVNFHKKSIENNEIELPCIITRGDVASYYGSILSFEDYQNGDLPKEWVETKRAFNDLLKLCQSYEFFLINN